MTSRNMGLKIPFAGISTTYVASLNSNWEIIDSHDHSSEGSYINQDSIGLTDVDLDGSSVTNASFISLSSSTESEDTLIIHSDSTGELFYTDGSNNAIQITYNGSVNIYGSYLGFYGDMQQYDATAEFSSDNLIYTFHVLDVGSSCYFLNYGTTTDDYFTGTLAVTSFLTVDSQTKIWTDSIFPGEYDSTKDSNGLTTFYFDGDGQPQKTYVVPLFETESSVYGNLEDCFLTTGTNVNEALYYYVDGLEGPYYINYGHGSVQNEVAITPVLFNSDINSFFTLPSSDGSGLVGAYSFPLDASSLLNKMPTIEPLLSPYSCFVRTLVVSPSFDFWEDPIVPSGTPATTYEEVFYRYDGVGLVHVVSQPFYPLANAEAFSTIVYYDYHIIWEHIEGEDPVDPSNVNVSVVFDSLIQYIVQGYSAVDDTGITNFFVGFRAVDKTTGNVLTNYRISLTLFMQGL